MPTINFKGKSFVENHHLTIPYHQLMPDETSSMTDKVSLNDNLVIHGDNLIALKALMPNYQGQVKCIYIDPPYNTGNEDWRYNDNVNSPMIKEWLKQNQPVDGEDLTRHDKWLCMMMPRLTLLRELLSEDGAIFINIDNNEVHHLRLLMDEIYGSTNFIDCVVWQKRVSPANDAKWFSSDHDYVLVYAKNKDNWRPIRLKRTAEQDKYYTNPDNDPRGNWNSSTYTSPKTRDERPNLYYPIKNPNTEEEIYPRETAVWRYSKKQHQKHVKNNLIYWGADGKGKPRLKRFLSEAGDVVPRSVWLYKDVGHTQEATSELSEIFPDAHFNAPIKPVRLIERIIHIGTQSDEEDIVLDAFAGSGTTGHAVLKANQEDGGNRKFILVEMEDYAKAVTAERIRRVITGVKNTKDESLQEGLEGSFSFFELGNPIDINSVLSGKDMPTYEELARYLFYVSTGEEFNPDGIVEKDNYIGESTEFHVYLFYKPDLEYLQKTSLNLDLIRRLPDVEGKKRLIFAPTRFVDNEYLEKHNIKFVQLPFEIYKFPTG